MTNIITCIDGSKSSQPTCKASVWVAKTLEAPITLLHVIDKSVRAVDGEFSGQIGLDSNAQLLSELVALDEKRGKLAIQHSKALLSDAKNWLLENDIVDVKKLQLHGDLASSLQDLEADMRVLVLGKSGEDNQDNIQAIGSQLESVIRTIKAHTLVVTESFEQPESFMLAFDGSKTSQKLIEKAIKTPLLKGLECHLVTVDDAHKNVREFQDAAERLRESGLTVIERELTGDIADSLLKYQQEQSIGMIVMGAYGHTKLRQFFVGSNTTQVLMKSTVPLLIIR